MVTAWGTQGTRFGALGFWPAPGTSKHRRTSGRHTTPGGPVRTRGEQTAKMSATRDDRLTVVLPTDEARTIRDAAEGEGLSLESFAVEAMKRYAREVLADRRLFRVPDTDWSAFEALLESPPSDATRLRRLLDDEPGAE